MKNCKKYNYNPILHLSISVVLFLYFVSFSAHPQGALRAPRDKYIVLSGQPEESRHAQNAALDFFMQFDAPSSEVRYKILYQLAFLSTGDIDNAKKYAESSIEERKEYGNFEFRRLRRISVYVDPPNAPKKGVYAAVDFSGRFENLTLYCGYIVLYKHQADHEYRAIRLEESTLRSSVAQRLKQRGMHQELENARQTLQRTCPGGLEDY